MFNKLISNLPFNPALVEQVAFYSKRLRKEQSVRRLGFGFLAIALVVQMVAVISPAQPSMAASNNDLINGGISSRTQATTYCSQNIGSYGDILKNYGITCSDVANSSVVSLRSTSANRQLFSMGRLPYGKAGETPVNIKGNTYYFRYLWSWDTGAYSTYQALQVHSSLTNRTYWLLYNCGNLVSVGVPPAYTPPAPPKPCIYNSAIPATDSRCKPPKCALDQTLLASDARCKACQYDQTLLKGNPKCTPCTNPNHGGVLAGSPQCKPVCQYNKSLDSDSPSCKPPCKYNSTIPSDSPSCKPCTQSQSSTDLAACLELSKKVSNVTQNVPDANGTTAAAGDTLNYVLSAKNDGKITVPKFVIQEDISDVLDYADVVDLHGGKLDPATNIVSWSAVDIKAGATASQQLTVKVKNPIPSTPVSSSDPGHYDLTMTNVYGNTVNVKLPPTTIKTTEQVVTQLPNTGPGTGIAISFAVALFAGYFLARTRLLAKETEIAVIESQSQGVMA